MQLSNRVQSIKPSATLAVAARASELKASGIDIVDLGLGEPDFDTPTFIKQAAIKAIEHGYTKYTAVDGTPALKKAIIEKFARENNLQYQTNQILVSCGAKQSIFNVAQALLNPGDEVIIPAPYWVSYPDIAMIADAKPVIVNAGVKQHFKITPEQLRSTITAKSKLFIINSPSNPTGMAYSRAELAALAQVLLQHPQIVVLTDDIYEHALWTKESFVNIVNACPDLYPRTIVVNGASKAYAMTGWRIGYAAGPSELIAAMKKVQSQSTSNPCSIAQYATEAALKGDQNEVKTMCEAYKKRHQLVYQRLCDIPGISCLPSDGTFYSFPDVSVAMKNKGFNNDVDFADFILKEAQVAVVPGSAFGMAGCIRLSYATSTELLNKALDRLAKALS